MNIDEKKFLKTWEKNYKTLIELRALYKEIRIQCKCCGDADLILKAVRNEDITNAKIEGMKIALIGLGYVCEFVDGECRFIDVT